MNLPTSQPASPAAAGTGRFWPRLRLGILLLVLVVAGTFALLGSNAGLQLGRLALPYVLPALQIAQVEGDLWQGVTLSGVRYQQDGTDLQLRRAGLQIDIRCWRQSMWCLDTLTLEGVRLTVSTAAPITPSATAATEASETPTETTTAQSDNAASADPAITPDAAGTPGLILPALRLAKLSLRDVALTIDDQKLQLASLDGALQTEGRQVRLSRLSISQLAVDLPAQAPTSEPWQNPLPALLALELPVDVQLDEFELTQSTFKSAGQPLLTMAQLRLSASLQDGHWQLRQFDTELVLPQQPEVSPVTLQGDITLDTRQAQLSLALRSRLPQGELQLQGQGPLRQMPLQLQGSGLLSASANVQLDLLSDLLSFKGKLEAPTLQWPLEPDTAAQLVLEQLAVQLSGDLNQQQLTLTAQSHGPALPLTDWQLDVALNAEQVQIQTLQARLLNGSITLSGAYQLRQQSLTADLQLKQLQPGLFWADYPGELDGNIKVTGAIAPNPASLWSLQFTELALQGSLRDQPLLLQGSLAVSQPTQGLPQLQTPGLKLSHGPNELALNGELGEQLTLDGKLQIVDLAYSLALAEGQLSAALSLRGDSQQPDLTLTMSGSKLRYLNDFSLTEVKADIRLPALGDKASKISLSAKQAQIPLWQIQQLDWQADGTRAQHQGHLLFDSHQLKAVLAYQGELKDQRWRSQLEELRLQADMGDWQLQAPVKAELDLAKQTLQLGGFCLLAGEGQQLCLDQTKPLSKTQGQLAVRLTDVPLQSLDPLLPSTVSLAGLLSGQAQAGWQQGKFSTLSWQLQSDEGLVRHQLTTPLELPWQQLQLNGNLQNAALTSELHAIVGKDSQLDLSAKLTDLLAASPQVQASLRLSPLSLKFIQPVFSEYSQFDGLLNANLRAQGALHNPEIYGNLAIDALQLTGKQAPLELTKASLLASFRGYSAVLQSNWQTPEGKLDLSGNANWLTPDAWFTQLDVQGEQLQVQLIDAELTVSPQLRLTASPHSGQISGNITVPAGQIRFDSLPENAIKVSDDEVQISAEQLAGKKSDWRLSSDIRLKIGDQVRLAAFGLKTRLQGDLRIRQQGLVPSLHGQVQLKDGSFRAYGQDLTLRKGRLTFNGPATQPLLAIEAIRNPEKTEDNVIAGLRVNGLADNPVVEVFSEPSKPQANALAYLLLGRDIGSSAGDNAVTTGLIGIGIANSGQLVGAIGEAFGISDLSLDTSGSGDKSKVTVSGYLSPRLQVKYGVGIFNQFGEFTLRYRLMQQVYIEAVRGLATSVDVLYKLEFD